MLGAGVPPPEGEGSQTEPPTRASNHSHIGHLQSLNQLRLTSGGRGGGRAKDEIRYIIMCRSCRFSRMNPSLRRKLLRLQQLKLLLLGLVIAVVAVVADGSDGLEHLKGELRSLELEWN